MSVGSSGLLQMTPEQREAARAKAVATQAANRARLRSSFPAETEAHWSELAKVAGVKLPPYGVPCTPGKMGRWLARLGISLSEYLAWNGVGLNGRETGARLGDFATRNPSWPLKAWIGLLLEALEDGAFGQAALHSAPNTPEPEEALL